MRALHRRAHLFCSQAGTNFFIIRYKRSVGAARECERLNESALCAAPQLRPATISMLSPFPLARESDPFVPCVTTIHAVA